MKAFLLVLASGLFLSCSSVPSDVPEQAGTPQAGSEVPEEFIVARVNGRPVYRGSYQHSLTVMRDRLSRRPNSVEDYINAKFDALDGLISNELLYQEAEREGVTVSESQLYGELERIGKAKGGADAFIAFMGTFGLPREEAIESVRKRLAVDRYIEETITRHIEADEEEIRAFYDENLDRFRSPLSVRISQVLIRCGRNAPAEHVEDRRSRAEELLGKIRNGTALATIARDFSEDRSSALDGDIGFVSKNTSYPELEAAAFELEVGEVSDVIRTDAGFHILEATERRGGEAPDFEAVEDACRRGVINRKRSAQVRALIDRLKETANIESYLN